MLQRFSLNFAIFSVLLDALFVNAALWLVSYVRPFLNSVDFVKEIGIVNIPPVLFIVFPLLWVALMMGFDVYDGRKNLRVVDEFGSLTWSTLLAAIAMAGVLYLSYREISRILFISFVLAAYICFIAWRAAARMYFRVRYRSATHSRRVLIAGMGVVGLDVAARIDAHKSFGLELAGYLDDNLEKRTQTTNIIFDTLSGARRVVLEQKITDVVITLPQRAHEKISDMVTMLHDTAVRVWLIPDYFNLAMHHAEVEDFAGLPMFDLRAPALSRSQRWVKRIFDLLLAGAALLALSPLMLFVAILILLDDGWPVIFRQKRMGENGHIFNMLKFRTMIKNAEQLQVSMNRVTEDGALIHKVKDDPRVTRSGKFLRKFSLDELPQLFNVLRGTMSLVGPRPELPFLVEQYQPWQRKRFSVPQGMTGWWQIHGRSDKPMHLHTEDDLYYIQNYSILLDIEILIKTAWVVIRGKGAY